MYFVHQVVFARTTYICNVDWYRILELDHSKIREFWHCAWHCLRVKKCGSTELKCCFIFFIFCSESQWDMRDIRRTHEHWMSIQKRSWVKLKMKGFLTHAKSINLCTQQKHLTLAATNAFIIWFFIKKNYMQNWHLNNDQSKRISQHFAYLEFFSSLSNLSFFEMDFFVRTL